MKKTTEKKSGKAKLELNKDVLKRLTNTELKKVMGGSSYNDQGGGSGSGSYSDDCGPTASGVGTRAGQYGSTSVC